VKEKLKAKFKIKGKTTIKGILFCQNIRKTLPKEMAISTYKKLHTGPKRYDGGAQAGLIIVEYQLYVLFISIIILAHFS
jgi:hypothetical protein